MKSNLKFKKEKLGILIPTGNFISAISLILTVFLILLYLIKAAENRQSKNIRPVEAKSVEFNDKIYILVCGCCQSFFILNYAYASSKRKNS